MSGGEPSSIKQIFGLCAVKSVFMIEGFLIADIRKGVADMYLALYRKYRPRIFDDVISQDHITTTLKNQLKNGQSSHAYLFTGSRGTGKTTCSKILAKALNCTNLQDGNPCLECASCKSIDEDYSDISEIDAASNNGVEYVRDLKEDATYAPLAGKRKVYIIDEVHMLSIAAFNALLKLIEEPPPHVVFILATTEVHKVPATILSRCQRFEFRRIDINDSSKRLIEVAGKEGKKLSDDAAFLISKISNGGMRDALSLLDQCFSVSDDVTSEIVRECAGISGSEYLFSIADNIHDGKTAEILKTLDELIDRSKDVTRLCEELISHYRSLMLLKSGADNSVIRATSDDLELLKAQCDKYSLEGIMRCIDILTTTFTSMNRVRTPSLMLEMCFIQLCTPRLDLNERSLSARIDKLEHIINTGNFPAQASQTLQQGQTYQNSQGQPSAPDGGGSPAKSAAPAYKAAPAAADIPGSFDDFVPLNDWHDILDTLPDHIRFQVGNTTARKKDNILLVEGSKFSVKTAADTYREEVQKAASDFLGYNVIIVSSDKAGNIPSGGQNGAKEDKVKKFLELARSRGINIKET